ncbi:NHLP bacteriocin export ABC transporter permease/ATPase subunit [Streptomyces sp. PKU-EA00015]|uniref:NHLP bacteriocin export ABC transporter permease/ATPase subunit n=1 Tax=Streptomyces sp. PKU-EA00015 TaxID=2748326 RepID=UPI0015A255AA|nr:NHLP bacteriocin export ABC transporter permease/ATPase subunit [Streptomyces sp. PKU-EA00015]
MSSAHPDAGHTAAAGTPETTDAVIQAFGGLGAPVDCTGLRSLHLEGPQVLWLVLGGFLDLFAVDAAEQGHWHFLGRLEPGTLLLGPVEGPRHTLVGRPSQECVLRRIALRELYQDPYGQDPYATQGIHVPDPYAAQDPFAAQDPYGHGAWNPLEHAFALGVGRSLGVLFEAPLDGRPADAGMTDEDILWMPVDPGSVRYGASYSAEAAADLLVEGAMWQRMVNQQYRLLSAVDQWIEQLERAHEDRAAAGIKAGEDVRARADEALIASIGKRGGARRTAGADSADAVFAVCRRVAEAAGITLTEPPRTAADEERVSPVERVAIASRVRTRPVRLTGSWWRTDSGPLVGHRAASGAPVALLWRRGRYEAVNPLTGSRTRIGKDNADDFEPRAVMFYRPLPERPASLRRLARFSLRGTRMDVRNLLLAGLVTVGVGALVPVATGKVLGEYVPRAETGLIVQMALAVMTAGIVSAAFMLLQNLTILRMEGRIESALQPAVWDRLLRLPTRFFTERSTGELASAAMGISSIRRVLSGIGPVALQSGTVGAMNVALLLWYSVPLALAAIGMLLVIGLFFLGMGLWQVRWQRRLVELGNKLNNQAFQTLRGLPKLRVAAAESFAYAAWAREFARSRELQQRVGRIRNLTTVMDAVYLPLCSLIMFMLLAGPARGSMSAGDFLTFNAAVTMLLTSVTQLTGVLVSAVAVLPMFEQVRPILDETPEVRGASAQPGVLSGEIEARRLSFRYTDDGPAVLDDVSLQVRPGEFVAVVGPSGCGKSTLLRLLIGFDRPAAGSVLYDGQDLSALDRAAVRRQCGVVLQNAQPLTGSILECISGAESFSQEEVWAAAEMAGLAEDIKRMPMGLHTMISNGGAISGGQRQRLMIAQALVRRPRILFFDEATSALDNETQRTVMDSTRKLSATRVVIAHRLTTVMDADRVLVMSDGRIVEEGRPADLLADPNGRLYELVRRQMA